MKSYTLLTLASFAALSQASPIAPIARPAGDLEARTWDWEKEHKSDWGWNKDEGKHDWWKGEDKEEEKKSIFSFTSTFEVYATPGEVVDANNTVTNGLEGASGTYLFGLNSALDVICYNITIYGFAGQEYQSPAETATHIHEAARGRAGPPRLAFPNPTARNTTDGSEVDDSTRYSFGCLTGPFTTGVVNNGTDSGEGFTIAKLEANPSAFFADVHTASAVPGAIRGQLA